MAFNINKRLIHVQVKYINTRLPHPNVQGRVVDSQAKVQGNNFYSPHSTGDVSGFKIWIFTPHFTQSGIFFYVMQGYNQHLVPTGQGLYQGIEKWKVISPAISCRLGQWSQMTNALHIVGWK